MMISRVEWVRRLLPLVLVIATVLTFLPSLANDFVEWDDDVNFLKNPHFRGLGWAQIRWAFSSATLGHYIPITWLTLSADYAIWGMNPFGYHLTNLILHVANVLLFYAVALRLLARAGTEIVPRHVGAAVAALFFALHPLRAESVAWVTERRDVLSGFFFLLTVLAYLAAVSAAGRRRRLLFAASAVAYAFALTSKSIVMMLPFVLVILDVYPLRRLTLSWATWRAQRAVLLEKIPYFALGAAGAAVAYGVVHVNKYLTPLDWPARIALGMYSTWFYVTTTLLPYGLSPVYEIPRTLDPYAWTFVRATLVVVGATVATVVLRRRLPWALAAWVAYVVILAPVNGIVHSGHQLAHDRYSYLSCLPWAVLVGAAVIVVIKLAATAQLRRSIALCAGGVIAGWLIVLGTMTWFQVQIWRDTETLFTYAVDSEPSCSVCHGNLGVWLGKERRFGLAIYHIEQSIKLRPERARPHMNLGLLMLQMDRRAETVRHLETALSIEPNHADTLVLLGAAFLNDNQPSKALGPLGYALKLEPRHTLARTNFGTALARLGDDAQAIKQYTRAIGIDPETAPPRFSLATLLARRGDVDGALAQYEVVKRLDPHLADGLRRQLQESW